MNNTTLEVKLKECSENYSKELNTLGSFEARKEKLPQERLKKLGFTSSFGITVIDNAIGKDLEFINTVGKVEEIIAFILEVKECFGKNVIVIKNSDFINIVKKYDLQCGSFDDYTGIVPEKNINEIENVLEIINKFYNFDKGLLEKYDKLRKIFVNYHYQDGRSIRLLRKFNEITITTKNRIKYRKELRLFNRIPILFDEDTTNEFNLSIDKKFGKRGFGEATMRKRNSSCTRNLFICAPRQEMKNSPKVITISRKQEEDPFICSLCDYGVVIYSSWGKEAEDEMLNKYRNFLRQ